MKKLLLSLGTVAAIVAPVTTVVACGKTATTKAPANPVVQLTDAQKLVLAKMKAKGEVTTSELTDADKTKATAGIEAAADSKALDTLMKSVRAHMVEVKAAAIGVKYVAEINQVTGATDAKVTALNDLMKKFIAEEAFKGNFNQDKQHKVIEFKTAGFAAKANANGFKLFADKATTGYTAVTGPVLVWSQVDTGGKLVFNRGEFVKRQFKATNPFETQLDAVVTAVWSVLN